MEGLHKRYRRREGRQGVSLEARSGEVVGLLGPNGAGKTTIFYMMVGLVRPDEGRGAAERRRRDGPPMHRRPDGDGLPPPGAVRLPETFRLGQHPRLPRGDPLPPGGAAGALQAILREMRIGHVSDTMGYPSLCPAESGAASRSPGAGPFPRFPVAGRTVRRHRPDLRGRPPAGDPRIKRARDRGYNDGP